MSARQAAAVAPEIIRAEGVSKSFRLRHGWAERLGLRPTLTLRAVSDVSFTLRSGTTFSLVGESGCGKSTLARVVAGIYRPDAGSIKLFGVDMIRADSGARASVRNRINMIFQDPLASLNPRWRVFDSVAEPLRVRQLELSRERLRERVVEAIELVRLGPDALGKYPHQFSGGQRQRICIARALTARPQLLICDEPTSALDVSVQAQVLNIMRDLQERIGLSYLLISHNLAVVHHMSHRVGVMYLGRLVEEADRDSLFEEPLHPYTRMLLSAIVSVRGHRGERQPIAGEVPSATAQPSGCAFHPRCPRACAACRERRPELREISGRNGVRRVACHLAERPTG